MKPTTPETIQIPRISRSRTGSHPNPTAIRHPSETSKQFLDISNALPKSNPPRSGSSTIRSEAGQLKSSRSQTRGELTSTKNCNRLKSRRILTKSDILFRRKLPSILAKDLIFRVTCVSTLEPTIGRCYLSIIPTATVDLRPELPYITVTHLGLL